MASIIWKQEPDDAYSNPYGYEGQKQFINEAETILEQLQEILNPRELKYVAKEEAPDLAVWMLRSDTIESLKESLCLIGEKRHKPAGILFREALETADLAYYFAVFPDGASRNLRRWFKNESPGHGVIRKWIEEFEGAAQAEARKKLYNELSKLTHRSYRALLKGYSLGGDEQLVHDSWGPSKSLVLPHTIAAFYCVLAELILIFIRQLNTSGGLSGQQYSKLSPVASESVEE
ncbi:MAG: hypothetical protein GY835_05785 [bacterium]|nr:hypothetical protein [bacterium]